MEVFNISYDNEINHRITQRNQYYIDTNIHLGVRPVSTNYDFKPILDKRKSSSCSDKLLDIFIDGKFGADFLSLYENLKGKL